MVSRAELIECARNLQSEDGENPEYDRALRELIYDAAGGESVESVEQELRADA